jgi:hypothetical protein
VRVKITSNRFVSLSIKLPDDINFLSEAATVAIYDAIFSSKCFKTKIPSKYTMKTATFWTAASCSVIHTDRCFRKAYWQQQQQQQFDEPCSRC